MKRFLLTAILCALGAAGQSIMPILPGEPNPNRYSNVKAYLALTDAQVAQLVQLRDTRSQAIQAIYDQINAKYTALNQLISSGSQDANAAGTLLIQIANLQRQINSGASQYHDSAVAVLTPVQKPKLDALDAARKLQPTIGEASSLGLLDLGQIIFYDRVVPMPLPAPLPADGPDSAK